LKITSQICVCIIFELSCGSSSFVSLEQNQNLLIFPASRFIANPFILELACSSAKNRRGTGSRKKHNKKRKHEYKKRKRENNQRNKELAQSVVQQVQPNADLS
jgi:hypothetical protein